MGCACSIRSSASIDVLQPVFVWLTIGSFSCSNSTSPSCFEELVLKDRPGERVDPRLQPDLDLGETRFRTIELGGIDDQSGELHPDAEVLDREVVREEARGFDRRRELPPDRGRGVRKRPGVRGDAGGGDRAPGAALLADAAKLLLVGQRAPEDVLGHGGEVVRRPVARLREMRGARRVTDDPCEIETRAPQLRDRADEIVTDLRRSGIAEVARDLRPRCAAGRYVELVAATVRERDPGDRRRSSIGPSTLKRDLAMTLTRARAAPPTSRHAPGDETERAAA